MESTLKAWLAGAAGALTLAGMALAPTDAIAGNGANFVLYNQHTEEKGETEIEFYSDFSNVGGDEKNYTAQLVEIEYGVTDLWTTSLYLEGAKTNGDDYNFGSFRFENRVRLFSQPTFFNPVLYAEYEQKEPESRYIRSVVGRVDDEDDEEEETEHELETKLILGHDVSDRLNVAFNWINEVNFDNGVWAFGYAAGLNYILFKSRGEDDEAPDPRSSELWDLEKVTLGAEFYGGLGDSVRGLTADPDKTQQYAGINLQAEFENHVHLGIGGAFGLTDESEDGILRLTAGYEFE
jgi:hypothetical protein